MALEAGEDFVLEFETDESSDDVGLILQESPEDLKFGYCTEFIINVNCDTHESEREAHGLRTYLETIGDSIVAVADEDIIKVHVHTNDPGMALQKGLSIGELTNLKIDNMREEHAKTDGEKDWTTVGVSTDIVEASLKALIDSIDYKLVKDQE